MKKLLLYLTLCAGNVFGQNLGSAQIDNYAGSNSVYLNPASIASSHWKAFVNIGEGSFIAKPNNISSGNVLLSGASFKIGENKASIVQNDLRGPALMVQLRNNHAFALTSRYRSIGQIDKGSDVFKYLKGDEITTLESQNFQYNSDVFSEYGLSYAAPVYDKNAHFLKIGATYKLITGLQTLQMNGSGNFAQNNLNETTYVLSSFESKHSDLALSNPINWNDVAAANGSGKGYGLDFGFVYQFSPHYEENKYLMNGKTRTDPTIKNYLVKVGFSVMDLGKINYNRSQAISIANTNKGLNQANYQDLDNVSDVEKQFRKNAGLETSYPEISIKRNLPTMMNIFADVKLTKNIYASIILNAANKKQDIAVPNTSSVSVGPRYEKNDFGFSIMGNYVSTYKTTTVSTSLRLGIFTFGTENLLGFFKKNTLYNHAYAGFFIPLGKWKRERDDDQDNVSNRKDQCRNLAGLWAFRGCPDTDGDGVEDKLDGCPTEAGPKESNGCPDADGDGIFDKNDACPNVAGIARFDGCPDSDGDDVPDHQDKCPEVPGLKELNGCPDSDLDGITDDQDHCPNMAGLTELMGCPLENLTIDASNLFLKKLTNQLATGTGITTEISNELSLWFQNNPKGKLDLIISGKDQNQIIQLAGSIKDKLSERFENRINASVLISESDKVGLALQLTNP